MSLPATAATLALPRLAPTIPVQYTVPGVDALTVPLTVALLEAGVITDAMLRTPRNALTDPIEGESERALSARALSHWWTRLIRTTPCKFFRWSLHVQQLAVDAPVPANTAWFCFNRMQGEIPRFALAAGVERLERAQTGLGQTVLAVLRDAMLLLPDSLNPWLAIDWVNWAWWQDTENDAELLEIKRIEHGYKSVPELLENERVITRAMFYERMPEWVCKPVRVLSREEIGSGRGEFAQRVVAVCDMLHHLVSRPDFVLRPEHSGSYRCGYETVDGTVVLLWKQFDVIGEAIDEYLNHLGDTGDYCEFIDANPVPMTAEGIREFQTLTKQKIEVAVLVEKLILLLGEKY